MNLRNTLLAAGLIALFALNGCIFSPDEGDDPVVVDDGNNNNTSVLVFPSTQKKVMDNFKVIYETMDYTNYPDMLHENFKTILLQDTIDEWGIDPSRPYFTYEDEVSIHEKLLKGLPGEDPDGNLVPGITSIQMDEPTLIGTWEKTSDQDTYFPSDDDNHIEWATHYVEFHFFRGSGEPELLVKGNINFYLIKTQVEVDGVLKDYWQMIGQQDNTNVKNY